jgi:DNA invertase Pin-like site-specific DNA recombinase
MDNSKKFLKTALIYVRQFRKERRNRYGIEEQEKIAREFATKRGYRVLEVFKDENSQGNTFERVGFQGMIEYIRSNKWKVKYLIVIDSDRFSTTHGELDGFRQFVKANGIQIISVLQTMFKYHSYRNGN